MSTPKISLKLKQKPEPKPEKTYYLAEGTMDAKFYKEYLRGAAAAAVVKRIKQYWKDLDDEDDEESFLEYKVFAVENANDNVVEYTECWLLDYENGYLPIFVLGINTSSCYAARRCHMDIEIEDGSEIAKTQYTLDEICELLADSVNKEKFKSNFDLLARGTN
jgi:hypothetical protein